MKVPNDTAEKLDALLACKRYEPPPPGYFQSFPDRLRARLEAEEFVEYSSLWQWLVNTFDAKPVVACVYGLALSSLLLAGFSVSQAFDTEVAASPVMSGPWLGWTPPTDVMRGNGTLRNGIFDNSNLVFPTALLPDPKVGSSSLLPGASLNFQAAGLISHQY